MPRAGRYAGRVYVTYTLTDSNGETIGPIVNRKVRLVPECHAKDQRILRIEPINLLNASFVIVEVSDAWLLRRRAQIGAFVFGKCQLVPTKCCKIAIIRKNPGPDSCASRCDSGSDE